MPYWLSANIVDSPCPPPPPTKYLSSNQSPCIARLAKSPSTRDNNALCVLLFTAQIDIHTQGFFSGPVPCRFRRQSFAHPLSRSSLKCHPYYSCFIEMQLHVQRLKEMQRLQTPLEIIARSGNCHPVLGRSSKDRDFFVHSRNFI